MTFESRPTVEVLKLLDQHLLNHFAFPAAELVREHPPRWFCKNKRLVYDLSCPYGADSFHGTLQYTRWKEFSLPKKIPVGQSIDLIVECVDDVFQYGPPEMENTVSWHLNFADANLFGYYGGRLFAQDESQCLEHPALCSLVESLSRVRVASPTLTTITNSQGVTLATPILIRGVERRAQVKTNRNEEEGRPAGLYGNQFAIAKPESVTKATTVFDQRLDARGRPYYSNIIAMEAPKYGNGKYTIYTIRRILATAYTGFLAAKFESMVELGLLSRNHDPKADSATTIPDDSDTKSPPIIEIHTGNWGCGAYGGNIAIMSLLQITAARLAGVNKLVYHAAGKANQRQFNEGLKTYNKLVLEKGNNGEGELDLDVFVHEVEKHHFQWGFSNGT
ncbi:7889_t:CDS:2 [Ambispora gerdemannii]|uniref:7889_t:CDS:1 n=1 Tax=Ambispora gerdemannii TaxID=144530 RepID=A0A9N9AV46_9GLOM|nr:7889_t:CDS:2 [Ambispora gerdemannii]